MMDMLVWELGVIWNSIRVGIFVVICLVLKFCIFRFVVEVEYYDK